jgi:hypothetical protein
VIAFDAIGCLATRSLGSTGWDGDHVWFVFSVDFPTDLCSLSQEKGRAGHWDGAGPDTDEYFVCDDFYELGTATSIHIGSSSGKIWSNAHLITRAVMRPFSYTSSKSQRRACSCFQWCGTNAVHTRWPFRRWNRVRIGSVNKTNSP